MAASSTFTIEQILRLRRSDTRCAFLHGAIEVVRRILPSEQGQRGLKNVTMDIIYGHNAKEGVPVMESVETELDKIVVPFFGKFLTDFPVITLEGLKWDNFGMLKLNGSPLVLGNYNMKINQSRFQFMLETEDQEVERQFKFQLCITLLALSVSIFKQMVCHRFYERPGNGCDKVPPKLEAYVFGGAIGWYSLAESQKEIGAPYQEERDDNGDVICGRKFKPEFIDALLNGEIGILDGAPGECIEEIIDRIALHPSTIVQAPPGQ